MSVTELEEKPQATSTPGDFAHIISAEDWEKGYIFGEEIRALCGYIWVPHDDPEKYPMCPACKAIVDELGVDE